jgi:hypothetical protein
MLTCTRVTATCACSTFSADDDYYTHRTDADRAASRPGATLLRHYGNCELDFKFIGSQFDKT